MTKVTKKNNSKKSVVKEVIKEKTSKSYRVVSPRLAKVPRKASPDDPLAKLIMNVFNEDLKNDFITFLQEKSKVVDINTAKGVVVKKVEKKEESKKEGKKESKKEGVEALSFRELTSYKNPDFSSPGPYSPAEYNPETIDVDTFTLMRRDHQLAAGLAVIKLPIVSLDFSVQCDDRKVGKTVEWALRRVWRDLIRSLLMAVDYGFASHEKVWKRDTVKISQIDKEGKEEIFYQGDLAFYKKIKAHHPESIKMKFDMKQNLIEIIQEGIAITPEIKLPIRKCFLFTNDKEFGNPFGISRLKNAYKVWYWKELLYQFMMQYFERRGTPPIIATAPPGKSVDNAGNQIDNLTLALRLASSLVSSSIAVLPYQQAREGNENTWKLDLMKDDARGPMFVEALNHLDARCLRSIFVPESILAQEGAGGFSGSSVHADLFLLSEKGLITDIEGAIDDQVIRPFIEANFPPDQQRPCHLKLDPLDWNRKIALKEIFIEMLRNADTMVQMGVPPSIVPSLEKMADMLDIPVDTWEEATGVDPRVIFDAVHGGKDEDGDEDGDGDGDGDEGGGGGKKETDSSKDKLAGRKSTQRKSVNQNQDRKRVNSGSRRTERKREGRRTKEN